MDNEHDESNPNNSSPHDETNHFTLQQGGDGFYFSCEHCTKSFTREDNLRMHLMRLVYYFSIL